MNKTDIRILGLSGLKESGKSTAFEIIKENYSNVFEIQLAKKLKDVCSTVFDIERSHFDDQRYKEVPLKKVIHLNKNHVLEILNEYGLKENPHFTNRHLGFVIDSPRKAAQYVGTELLREYDSDIHCNAAIRDALRFKENNNLNECLFVVTDMRFPNELDFFTQKNGFLGALMINRSEKINAIKSLIESGVNVHSSETSVFLLAPKCTEVWNDGTVEDFKKTVLDTVKRIIKN